MSCRNSPGLQHAVTDSSGQIYSPASFPYLLHTPERKWERVAISLLRAALQPCVKNLIQTWSICIIQPLRLHICVHIHSVIIHRICATTESSTECTLHLRADGDRVPGDKRKRRENPKQFSLLSFAFPPHHILHHFFQLLYFLPQANRTVSPSNLGSHFHNPLGTGDLT